MSDKNQSQHRGRPFRGKRLRTHLPRPERAEAAPPEPKQAERIAKVMARAGLCSRREAETWIAAGRVSVNGQTISSPALNVTSRDRVEVDGEPLPTRERTRLFLFNKPRGLVTTSADTHGRPTIFGALPKDLPRLISVGRLDMNTEGLLLLTNDGGLARALELPETGWLRRYRVRAHGKVTQLRLDRLKHGIEIDGIRYGAIEATLEREQGSNVWLTFAMREGKNREVKNVLGHLGLAVARLIRVSYGPFQLGELASGAVEEVRTRTLREQLGERLAAIAGADFSAPLLERDAGDERAASAAHVAASLPPRSGGEGQRDRRSEKKQGGGPLHSKRPPSPTGEPRRAGATGTPPPHRSQGSRGEGSARGDGERHSPFGKRGRDNRKRDR